MAVLTPNGNVWNVPLLHTVGDILLKKLATILEPKGQEFVCATISWDECTSCVQLVRLVFSSTYVIH